MRKLLNTLFITSEDCYLALEGENVTAYREEEKVGQFPLHTLESIVTFSYKGASPALMGACARRGINFCFMTPRGRFLARTVEKVTENVLLRKEQFRISDDEERSCLIARNCIFGKVFNSRWSIERTIRDHAMRADTEKLKKVSVKLKNSLPMIRTETMLEILRGPGG